MNEELKLTQSNKLIYTILDYLFWILIILYTDPGGLLYNYNTNNMQGEIKIYDLIFIVLSICFIAIPKNKIVLDKDFIRLRKYLFIFLFYYFAIYGYVIPVFIIKNHHYSFLTCFVKSRTTIYNLFIFIYIYEFFKRSWDIFIKLFIFSSILVLMIFLFGIMTKINILPVLLWDRGFISINRNIMVSEGIMELLIPFGIVSLVFDLKIKFRSLILMGFVLMSVYFMLSLTRRSIISIFAYFILAMFLMSFITNHYGVMFKHVLKVFTVLIFIIISSYFVFPKYVEAARISIIESVDVVENGKTSNGHEDQRLGLRPFIVQQFLKHPIWGAGFDNRWRGSPKADKAGYEPSDYPFLAALAMFGMLGLLVYLPVYFVIIKVLKYDITYLKSKKIKYGSTIFLLLITFILYFTYHFFQYFNYFMGLSNSGFFYGWYFFLSLYLATRAKFYLIRFQKFEPKLIS